MKKRTFVTALCVTVVVICGLARGQVATGTPKYGSFGGGPLDTVNLGNLNVHLDVPIVNKAGRGTAFTYDLDYDSSVWYPVTVGGQQQWQSTPNWGWHVQTEAITGYVSYTQTGPTRACLELGTYTGNQYTQSNWTYHDVLGAVHLFAGSTIHYQGSTYCPPDTSLVVSAGDGSGWTLSAVGLNLNNMLSTSGMVIQPPLNSQVGLGSLADANGNEITADNSGNFYDTLSSSSPVVTVTGAGTPTSPMKYTYLSPVGSATFQVNYTQYTVKTDFGISTIREYGPLSNPLVSSIGLPDGSEYTFTYETTPGSCTPLSGTSACVTGRIQSVTLPTGGSVTYSYSGGTNGIEEDGSTAGLSRETSPGGTWTYSRSNVSGSQWQTKIIDPAGNETLINFQESSNGGLSNFYETERQVWKGTQSSGTLLNTNYTCYNGQSLGTPSNCPTTAISSQISQTTVFRYIPDSTGVEAETNTLINANGLTTEVDDYDYGPVGQGPQLIRETKTQYNGTLGNGIVDRPSNVSIYDSTSHLQASTSYNYDETTPQTSSGTPQHVTISGSRGLLTSVIAEANGSTNLYRKYTYWDTGNLSTSTDVSTTSSPTGATTTYNYASGTASCGNSFVTSITEPLSLSRSMTWDCNGGVMLSLTDENGNTSSTAYSGSNYSNYFWRPYNTTDQAGNVTNYFYTLNSSNQPFQTESKSATFNSGNSVVDVLTTNDGFGRTIFRQTKQSPSATSYDTVATCYDSSGRVQLTTLPYSNAAITSGTASCPSKSGTSYTYDALNRQSIVSDSGGGQTQYTYTYNDVAQTLTSPSQSKQSEYDGLGRLKSLCEINAGTSSFPAVTCAQNNSQTGYWTTYTYDVLGDITGVTQNVNGGSGKQQTRAYVYDMLGRLTKETNPETNNVAVSYTYDVLTNDASCGSYTSAGNMVKRLDAATNATCYSAYDALHRVGTITYPSTSTPEKKFVYDTAIVNGTAMIYAKTRLAEAYTCIGTCSSKATDLGFSYSKTGQTTDVYESTPNSGGYYHVNATPWPNGGLNILQDLPGLPTFTYSADGEGRLGTVSASSGQNPITSVGYDAMSHVTALTYGSGDSDAFQYYSTTGRMQQYQFTVGSSPKTDTGILTWNANGTLETLAITDQLNSANTQTCAYTHDAMGRVASANCGSSIWSQTFSFDPFNNITKSVPNGATGIAFNPTYNISTNRFATLPGATPTYDANGNLTGDGSNSYTFDTAGNPVSIDGVAVTYDALDRAVEHNFSGSYVQTVYTPAGSKLALMSSQSLAEARVPLPGGALARYTSSGLSQYWHPDWLRSSRLETTPTRTVAADIGFAPYGETYVQSGGDLTFTGGGISDTAQGIYDFLYREYNPNQSRWVSPDRSGLTAVNPADPQSWNRYGYVGNRPLGIVDFQGLELGCFDDGLGGCGPGGGPGGGYCPPEFGDCCDPDFGCDPGPTPPPFPPGGGGGYPGPYNPPAPKGGVWPNNETPGLPTGLNTSPLSNLSSLLGLLPGLACGGNGSIGSGFADGSSVGDASLSPCTVVTPIPLGQEANPSEGIAENQSQGNTLGSCFGGGLQACLGECQREYDSCQLREGPSGWICLIFGPTERWGKHGPLTCGSFGSDVCLSNKGWCNLGCRSGCVGPWPPTLPVPPVGPPHTE